MGVVGLSLTSVFLIFFVSGEAKTADNGQNRCTWHGKYSELDHGVFKLILRTTLIRCQYILMQN